jgi:pimeloyl-ACP methyl ester carboxylesterase
VLAGHSYGGLYSITFAAAYPDQVAGLVLIDSTSPAARAVPAASALRGRLTALLPAAAHLGVARLYGLSSYDSLPPPARDEARAGTATADYVGSVLDELAEGPTVVRQASALADLHGKPLVVLTAGADDARWQSRQNRLAALSTNSSHRVLPDATHDSLLLDRGDTAAVSTAIRDVVVSVRQAAPLR